MPITAPAGASTFRNGVTWMFDGSVAEIAVDPRPVVGSDEALVYVLRPE